MTNYIWITTQFEGFHRYKDAPKEVAFLKKKHRHIFKVKVAIEIGHNNRDIEFIMFKHDIDKFIESMGAKLNNSSCEMIADKIHAHIKSNPSNHGRKVVIEVSEDGENGCMKEYG